MNKMTMLLKSELRPALGVTEIAAIALATARAATEARGEIISIYVEMNQNMYKNAFSCNIPGTKEIGGELAALLGALYGDWEKGLECLYKVTQQHAEEAKKYSALVETEVITDTDEIYIRAKVVGSKGTGCAQIEKLHTNITKVWRNDVEVYSSCLKNVSVLEDFDFDAVTLADFYEYAKTVPLEEISFLQNMVDMNCALAEAGKVGTGMNINKTISLFLQNGMIQNDVILQAQRLTSCAMDARLSGLPLPAMSIVGSGSHGIVCSLPVISYGQSTGKTQEQILRALALSCLVTIYSKHYTGRLSSVCGCVLGGGSGAAVGLVYLMGGTPCAIATATEAMAANLSGMICDGGSIGCSLKVYSGVQAAFLSAMIAVSGTDLPHPFGIVGTCAEQTVKNMGLVSTEGMATMDATLLSIMRDKK